MIVLGIIWLTVGLLVLAACVAAGRADRHAEGFASEAAVPALLQQDKAA